MSDKDSDGFNAFDLADFTEEDFAQVDAEIKTNYQSVQPDESFEFDASKLINLSELTEEELAEIDNAIVRPQPMTADKPPPLEVELEDLVPRPSWPRRDTYAKGKRRWGASFSLMDRFRKTGILTVSDLVTPAWCEVQFDYGLRQKRFRPIDQRPASFVSASGKEISVENKVAEKNNERTEQGRAVHKSLEREVRFEELKIDISSEEERWALRLVNMIASLQLILDEGFTREMPVFGLVNGEVVVGIVDEISKIPTQRGSAKRRAAELHRADTKRLRRSPSPNQPLIDTYLEVSINAECTDINTTPESGLLAPSLESNGFANQEDGRFLLHVIDTKTRVTDSIPLHDDTVPSRLQVMLYCRLLSDLISMDSSPSDFNLLWDVVGVDPLKVFSTKFLVQANLLSRNDGVPSACLDTLTEMWQHLVSSSSIAGVDTNLELVYRLQPKGTSWKRKGKGKSSRRQVATNEGEELAKAIAASLSDVRIPFVDKRTNAGSSSSSINQVIYINSSTVEIDDVDPHLQKALHESMSPGVDPPLTAKLDPIASPPGITVLDSVWTVSPSPAPSKIIQPPDDEQDIYDFKIIGRKEFLYDALVLQSHVDNVLDLWHGMRKPRGVPVTLSRRCNSCEYRDGCEWREEKALEFNK